MEKFTIQSLILSLDSEVVDSDPGKGPYTPILSNIFLCIDSRAIRCLGEIDSAEELKQAHAKVDQIERQIKERLSKLR